MQRDLGALTEHEFDLVVVGGGVYGAAVAWDACLRGLSVALAEKDDFGGATSFNNLKTIHGGLRYLRQFEFGLVRQDMREREVLLKIAPHLVSPLKFLIPVIGPTGRITMAAGMRLYDLLSYDKSLPSYRFLSLTCLCQKPRLVF